jgi:putative transposase
LVDGFGVPLSLVASGANTHDVKLLDARLDQVVMEIPGRAGQYNLCADAGYKGTPAMNAVTERDYNPHIKQRRVALSVCMEGRA